MLITARCILFLITCGRSKTWARPFAPRDMHPPTEVYSTSLPESPTSPTYSLPVIVTEDSSSAATRAVPSPEQTAKADEQPSDSASAIYSSMPTTASTLFLTTTTTTSPSPYSTRVDGEPATRTGTSGSTAASVRFSCAPHSSDSDPINTAPAQFTYAPDTTSMSNTRGVTVATPSVPADSSAHPSTTFRTRYTTVYRSSGHSGSTSSANAEPAMSRSALSSQRVFTDAPETFTSTKTPDTSPSSYAAPSPAFRDAASSTSTSSPKAGGITIIPVEPYAGETITITDAAATQTVTETVARMTITAAA